MTMNGYNVFFSNTTFLIFPHSDTIRNEFTQMDFQIGGIPWVMTQCWAAGTWELMETNKMYFQREERGDNDPDQGSALGYFHCQSDTVQTHLERDS